MTVKAWQHSGIQIFNGSSPVSWTDLDLTAGGAPIARVFAALEVKITSAAEYVSFRPNGDTADYLNNAAGGHGCASAKPNSAGPYSALILAVSDTSGLIEWISGSSQTVQITLLGYIELDYDGSTVFTGSFPTIWTLLDLSAYLGSNSAFSLLRVFRSGGFQNEVAFRKNGASGTWLQDGTGIGGANQSNMQISNASLCVVNTDSSGRAQVIAGSSAPDGDVTLLSYGSGEDDEPWYISGITVHNSIGPTSWTDLDLGTQLRNKRGFAVLSIKRDSQASGTIVGYGFRPNGSSDDYLDPALVEPYGAGMCAIDASENQLVCVETDSNGVVEWKASGFILGTVTINVVGYFSVNTPPAFSSKLPTGSSELPDVQISCSISDDTNIVLSTVNVVLTDPDSNTHNAITGGVFQSSYNGQITANSQNGYDILIGAHPIFAKGSWQVDVEAYDDHGKKTTDTWSFTVTSDPQPQSFSKVFKAILPPWLLRTEGTKLIGGISDVIDDHRDRLVGGVKLRFPGLYSLEGIDRIGKERRLRRGPTESSEVFADRLLRWWEDHRIRGNAYALLEQMQAYFIGTLAPPYDVVSYRGLRHIMDANGDITRDSISWGNDESGNWAQVWIFLYFTSAPPVTDIDQFSSIVKDWISAHVDGKLVIIHPDTRLWDYPQPVPDWSDTWDWDDGPTVEELS